MTERRRGILRIVGPGLLVAATGVGAGDLATAAFTGSHVGIAVLWAVVVGAFLKFVLNEGLARWQLATGETLLEGAVRRIGRPVKLLCSGTSRCGVDLAFRTVRMIGYDILRP